MAVETAATDATSGHRACFGEHSGYSIVGISMNDLPVISRIHVVRGFMATAASLAAAVLMRSWGGCLPAALWMPTGLLVLAAGLVHHRSPGSQILARGVWWSNAILATVVTASGSRSEASIAGWLAVATGSALLAAGRRDLERPPLGAPFSPLALRTSLTLLLVMALADVQTFGFLGALDVEEASTLAPIPVMFLAIATLMGIAVVGLYCLRVWGVLASVVGNVALGFVLGQSRLDLPAGAKIWLGFGATLQLTVAVLLLRALARGVSAAPPRLSRVGVVASTTVIVGIVLYGLSCARLAG
jgi:hypothetical protein